MEILYPSQLVAILKALQKQKELDQVTEQYNRWAFLASIITNGFNQVVRRKGKAKLVKPEDFLSKSAKKLIQKGIQQAPDPPEHSWDKHIEDAKAKGLDGPWGGDK